MRDLYRAIADKNRRKIIHLLMTKSMSVNELLVNFSIKQATLSAHLSYLLKVGLVRVNQHSRRRVYSIEVDKLRELGKDLKYLFGYSLENNINGDITDISGMSRK